MKILILADIHGNLPALQAVLDYAQHRKPDMIISLGDQINIGPCGREVMDLLREHHVLCLRGNHERYVLQALAGDPKYKAANFASIRFLAERFTAEELSLPMTWEIGDVLFCHALPQDDRFPVPYPNRALPDFRRLDRLPARHIICGHGHDPRHYVLPQGTVDVVGSLGCMDRGMPGWACCAELVLQEDSFCLTNRFIPYDTSVHRELFLRSGYASACPVMARLACMQLEQNRGYMVAFVNHALELSRQLNEPQISAETWRRTDSEFGWPDAVTAMDFWQAQAEATGEPQLFQPR